MDRPVVARKSRGSSTTTDAVQRRVFACSVEGCNRSFTRSEHLHRHALNHAEGDSTCTRCRAHFKRKDLLERHMNRHRQRDEEAGGEGNGVLNTRKRMWKDHDGRIVAKKPKDSSSSTSTAYFEPKNNSNLFDDFHGHHQPSVDAPISPPISSQTSDHSHGHRPSSGESQDAPFLVAPGDGGFVPDNPFPPTAPTEQHQQQQYIAQEYNAWLPPQQQPPRGFMSSQLDINYDDVFQPDTASSFNMPYTTQVNYNWLFNLDSGLEEQPRPMASSSASMMHHHQSTQGINAFSLAFEQQQQQQQQPPVIAPMDAPINMNRHTPESLSSASSAQLQEIAHGHPSPESERSVSVSLRGKKPGFSGFIPAFSTSKDPSSSSKLPPANVDFERPLSFLGRPPRLPLVDEFTYSQILETIELARPLAPDAPSLLDVTQPLLSLSSLQSYCDLFFTKFNTAYPLIHQPTFDPNRCEPLLLLSIILLGATYSGKDAHQLAVCVHDVIRPQIFSHASFNPKPDLWVLQTILLVECFGKSRAGQKQHDMSHLFHGMLINLIRRSDCQSVRPNRSGAGEPEVVWRQWAEAEEKKRLALLCFMWDTQHAVLFCQSLCMSAFELRLPLPCEQIMWEASTAGEWTNLAQRYPPEPMFLLALKSYLTADAGEQRHSRLNGLSRIIIFHGLMSIFWDMERRDQTSLGVIPSQTTGRWQTRLETAYHAWKADFDDYCKALAAVTEAEIRKGAVDADVKGEVDAWRTAYVAVYHAAYVLLHSEFLDIQIYAGARHILGKPVQRTDYLRSERVVKRWAGSSSSVDSSFLCSELPQVSSSSSSTSQTDRTDPVIAAWHAAHLLEAAAQTLTDYDSMSLFHVPWCLYLATLTIWTFHHAIGTHHNSRDDGQEMVWDAEAEMLNIVECMAISEAQFEPRQLLAMQGRMRTGGLVHYFAGVLGKVRWGIVHAGVTVLKGLVPSRLVCQFEGVR